MTRLRVTYEVDEHLGAAIQDAVRRNQGMFADDLTPILQNAARRVIKGNFTGQGGVNPRPVGEFTSPSSRRYRGWIERAYGSDRARMAGQGRASSEQFEHLRNRFVLDAARQVQPNNPALKVVRAQALKAQASDPLAWRRGEGFETLRGFITGFPKLTRRATRRAQHSLGHAARFGVQTGKLAAAWYDLGVSITTSGNGLRAEFTPSAGRTPGSPDALRLTQALARQAGPAWRGVMDHAQLIDALRDAGVIARG